MRPDDDLRHEVASGRKAADVLRRSGDAAPRDWHQRVFLLEKLVALPDGSVANVEVEAEAEGRQTRAGSAVNDEDHLDDAANPGADHDSPAGGVQFSRAGAAFAPP